MNQQALSTSETGFTSSAALASVRASQRYLWWLMAAAILLLIYRAGLMLMLPLADTTEARYGEIARLTLSNGFWLMPHMDMHTPFFAKPPLSTWASAISMSLFGLNEFAARLPSLLVSLLAGWIAFEFAGALQIRQRWLVVPVLTASPLFFISAGAVMTDAVQMTVISAALYFAWRAFDAADSDQPARRWRLAFWAMIGLGALSKGLATWALIGLPMIAYAFIERRPLQMFRQIFDWSGVGIALCIFVPWYAAAEHYYPGFIDYFIVGEHFSRFLVPGWNGDRYGTAHREPLGAIWVFWVAAILPWIGVFASELSRVLFKRRGATLPLERFLWCATLTPLVFFTFASNIIWTYGLTALVPFAVLVARWLDNASSTIRRRTGFGIFALAIATILLAPILASNVNGNSDRDLVAAFKHAAAPGTELVYLVKPNFSSSYYTQGALRYEPHGATQGAEKSQFVVIDKKDLDSFSTAPNRILFTGTRRVLVEQR